MHLLKNLDLFYECFTCVWKYTVCIPGAHGGRKRGSDLLELELWMVVSCHVDVGTKPWSFAMSALNC